MKSLAIILSVYIVVLAVMPCADAHDADNGCISFDLIEQTHSHLSDVDFCSPFCSCTCCQTLSQPTLYSTFQINLLGLELTTPLLTQNELKSDISFWRPPKS